MQSVVTCIPGIVLRESNQVRVLKLAGNPDDPCASGSE